MAEGIRATDLDSEAAYWRAYQGERERQEKTSQRVAQDERLARRLDQIATQHPHLAGDVAYGLALTDASDRAVDEAARLTAPDTVEQESFGDRAFGTFKGVVRSGTGLIQSVWQDVVDRPARSVIAASDEAFSGEPLTQAPQNLVEGITSIPEKWRELPGSTFAEAVDQGGIGQFFDSSEEGIGSGFLPGGEVERRRQEKAESVTFKGTGEPVTVGDLFAGIVAEPGTEPYEFTRALTGTAWEFFSDPLLLADKPIRTAISARTAFASPAGQGSELRRLGLVNGTRKTVLPEQKIDNWLNSRRGLAARKWLRESDDFEEIRSRLHHGEASLRLKRATTDDEVTDLLRHYAGRGEFGRSFGSPLSHKFRQSVQDTSLGRMWEQATDLVPQSVKNTVPGWERYARLGSWTPKDAIPLNDATEAAEQLNRWFRGWKAPKELGSKYGEDLADAVVSGDRNRAWGVWQDANRALGKELKDRGHDKDVVDALTRMQGGPDFGTGINQRAFWREQVAEPPQTLRPGTRMVTDADGSHWVEHLRPHRAVELMDEAIPMGNQTEIRRATSTLSRLAKVPGVKDLVDPTAPGVAKGLVWNAHDALWWTERTLWMPMMLVTRIAWPARVVGEEQLRMAAVGLESAFRHPASYMSWALGNDSKPGKALSKVVEGATVGKMGRRGEVLPSGTPVRQLKEFSDSMVRDRPRALHGRHVKPGTAGWDFLDMRRANTVQRREAMQIELGKAWKDDVSQKIADSILAGDNSLDDVYDWFYGSTLHDGMMSTSDDFSDMLSTPEGVRSWLDSEATRLRQVTGDDVELLETVSTRSLPDATDLFDVRPNRKPVRSFIDKKVRGLNKEGKLPSHLPVPHEVISGETPGHLDKAVTQLFYALGAFPSNVASRSPTFKQFMWNRMAELAEHSDTSVQKAILQGGMDARLPKSWVKDVRGRIEKTAGRNANRENLIQSIDEAEKIAGTFAARKSSELLYSLAEKGQTAEAMRLAVPFGEAWKEIGLTWSKIMSRTPMHARRAQIIYEGAQDSGFFFTDPNTDKEAFITAPGGLIEPWMFDEPTDDVRPTVSGQLEGLNLFAGQVVPGLGPMAAFPLDGIVPDTPDWDSFRETFLPFGTPVDSPSDLLDPNTAVSGLMPAWMTKFVDSFTEGSIDSRMWAGHVVDATRALKATGNYPIDTPEGRRKLDEDAKELARKTLRFRAIGQAILPTGPRVDFQVKANSPEAEKMAREVLGDIPFGRTDKGFFSQAVLGSLWHELRNEANGDSYAATHTFLEMLGWDPEDWDKWETVGTIAQGKTTEVRERATSQAGVDWEREHPELVEALPNVVGLLAPDQDGEGGMEAWFRQVENEDRVPLTGEQFIKGAQKVIGNAIYNNQRKRVEGRNDEAARAHKAQWRAWLDENMPYWRWDREIEGVPGGAGRDAKIEELGYAIDNFEAARETPAGQGLFSYWEKREKAINQALGMGGVETREQAIQRLRSANSTEHLRSWLRGHGEYIASSNGDFRPIWRLFETELGDEPEGDQ